MTMVRRRAQVRCAFAWQRQTATTIAGLMSERLAVK